MGSEMCIRDRNTAIALLGNTIPTGAILIVLIVVFGPVSGAHFNPAVTVAFLIRNEIGLILSLIYILVQILGGLTGVWSAHFMFEEELIQFSLKERTGSAQWFSELFATFGLLMAIFGALRWRPEFVPYSVGLYITAAYWFTASTSFANPAVNIARSFSNTFSGIFPGHAPWHSSFPSLQALCLRPLFSGGFLKSLNPLQMIRWIVLRQGFFRTCKYESPQ